MTANLAVRRAERKTRPKAENVPEQNDASFSPIQRVLLLMALGLLFSLLVYFKEEEAPLIDSPPPVLVLEAWHGKNHHRMNGFYYLQKRRHNGRPVWAKKAPGIEDSESYLLYDDCKAWLLSHHETGGDDRCDGWAYAGKGCKVPWDCAGKWQVYRGRASGWGKLTELFEVTPLWHPELLPTKCNEQDEKMLEQEFGSIDIVVPWVNGSDSAWLKRRHEVCYDFMWRWVWPDAARIIGSKSAACVLTNWESIPPSGGSSEEDSCSADDGGSCASAAQKAAETSPCFRSFAEFHCGGRVRSIADHDELRYLMRSLEAHLRWHRGRVVLILPRGQRPVWLKDSANLPPRLEVVDQEYLLESLKQKSYFLSHEERGGWGGVLPNDIFNDFPIQNAFHLIPNVSREILLMDDDLIVAKPMSVCELFTASKGLKVFADPWFKPDEREDPYRQVFRSLVKNSARAWEVFQSELAQNEGKALKQAERMPYYDPFHAPRLLRMPIFEHLWEQFSEHLSATTDSAVRHPHMVDIIGLHHSEVAARSLQARRKLAADVDDAMKEGRSPDSVQIASHELLSTWMLDLQEYPGDLLPVAQRWFWEVYFDAGTSEEWKHDISHLPGPYPEKLPQLLSFQDHISTDGGLTLEMDCERERWLTQLLPKPSSFERDDAGPDRCSRLTEN